MTVPPAIEHARVRICFGIVAVMINREKAQRWHGRWRT